MKDIPNITPELILWLQKTFIPVTDTRGIDLREIDFKSGQHSVVEHLKAIHERQKRHGTEHT
jgi:hypothetical protein